MKVTLPTAALAAVAPFMAARDVRYYLNGLRIEIDEQTVRCIATDGHALAVCRVTQPTASHVRAAVILPSSLVAKLIKHKGVDVELSVVPVTSSTQRVDAFVQGAMYSEPAVEGRYPEWQAVFSQMGDETDGRSVMLMPELLDKAVKSAKVFKRSLIELRGQPVERAPMQFRLSNMPDHIDVAGVLMPARLVTDQRPAATI